MPCLLGRRPLHSALASASRITPFRASIVQPRPTLGSHHAAGAVAILSTRADAGSSHSRLDRLPQWLPEWARRPCGTALQPATEDRFMDLKRFAVACVYRGGSDPWPIKAPLPVVLFSFHAASLYAATSLFVQPPSAELLTSCGLTYAVLTFSITAGHHRYFSHRSYKTSRGFQFLLALTGCLAWQRGPIWWSSHHNFHHQHSDTENDPHSPITGSFLWSHMGWYWASSEHDAPLEAATRKWKAYPELLALDRLHMVPGIVLFSALYATGGAEAVLWGYVVPVVGCWNGIFSIGSLCHGARGGGTRPFETGGADRSTNVWWVALLTLGDGWHNNHHAFRWSCRQGLRWYELDVTYGLLRALERLGLVWDLAVPTPAQIARAEARKSSVATTNAQLCETAPSDSTLQRTERADP